MYLCSHTYLHAFVRYSYTPLILQVHNIRRCHIAVIFLYLCMHLSVITVLLAALACQMGHEKVRLSRSVYGLRDEKCGRSDGHWPHLRGIIPKSLEVRSNPNVKL